MRFLVEVRKQDEERLRRDALHHHRTLREHAEYLIRRGLDDEEAERERASIEQVA